MGALDRSDRVKTVRGMARRPFDPSERGWSKVEYRQGDVLDRESVEELVAGADVVGTWRSSSSARTTRPGR